MHARLPRGRLSRPALTLAAQRLFLSRPPRSRSFKSACRALGLTNWPYRRRKSVAALLENIAGEEDAEEVMRILRAEDEALLQEPGKGLCRNFKRLRQAFYKEKYRGRKGPSGSAGGGGGSGQRGGEKEDGEEEEEDEGEEASE